METRYTGTEARLAAKTSSGREERAQDREQSAQWTATAHGLPARVDALQELGPRCVLYALVPDGLERDRILLILGGDE